MSFVAIRRMKIKNLTKKKLLRIVDKDVEEKIDQKVEEEDDDDDAIMLLSTHRSVALPLHLHYTYKL